MDERRPTRMVPADVLGRRRLGYRWHSRASRIIIVIGSAELPATVVARIAPSIAGVGALDIPPVGSKSTGENQYDQDDQDDADDADAAVPEAVAIAAQAATEASKQEDDEKYDEYGSERHDLSPLLHLTEH